MYKHKFIVHITSVNYTVLICYDSFVLHLICVDSMYNIIHDS